MKCTNCGAKIRPKHLDKGHRCRACGQVIARAKLSDSWKVIQLGERQESVEDQLARRP